MLNKREVIEMIYRTHYVEKFILEGIISKCMTWENYKLINEFKKSTQIDIEYSGGGMFKLNY